WISTFTAVLDLIYTLTLAAFADWQLRSWNALREAAFNRYETSRNVLKEQRAKLAAEIAAFDGLTLRQMEREAIMKGVLRWLFGPTFELVPTDIEDFFPQVNPADPMTV